jgi:FAD binding domain/Berberine and berberine like
MTEIGLKGRVIGPNDAEYDHARTIFLGGFDRRPALIARPIDTTDVARVIAYARERQLAFSVRSGGHSGAGHCTNDGGIVLDLRDMKALEIDAASRTAWAETGLSAGEYSTGVGAHGLATGFGDTGSVGIGGITLAGGIGYLARKHGMTIDSVLGAHVVTASGETLHVNAESHPELFWAIRGGGGNFGIVTRFQYKLQPVDQVVGGMLMLPATPDVIVGAIDVSDAAPEELTTIINVMPAPPMPFVPKEHHGRLVAMILLCYAGDAEAGTRAIAPLKALATPLVDMVKPMRYPEIYPPEDESYHPKAIARTLFIDRVDRRVATMIIDYLQRSDASLRVAQLRVLGGAMARVPADATAFAHRTSRILANVAAFYDGPDDRPRREAWVTEFADALHQGDAGAYVAFLANEGEQRVRAAYPGSTWDRLAAIKARYDPDNVFRMNQNVPPSNGATSSRRA